LNSPDNSDVYPCQLVRTVIQSSSHAIKPINELYLPGHTCVRTLGEKVEGGGSLGLSKKSHKIKYYVEVFQNAILNFNFHP